MSNPERYSRNDKGGFHGIIDVYHQLHCLVSCFDRNLGSIFDSANDYLENMIGQFTWLDHYKDPPEDFLFGDVASRMHVDHCIDSLRQYLMCTADVTPVFLELTPNITGEVRGDFSTFHKCRNFQRLSQWLDEHLSPDLKDFVHGKS
jgi:hypothetical protein